MDVDDGPPAASDSARRRGAPGGGVPPLTPRELALAALELYRLRLAGVLNWIDRAASGRAGDGGGFAAGGGGPSLSGGPDALQAALDQCVEYLLVGEASFQGERERLLAHAARHEELVRLRGAVAAARSDLGATVVSALRAQEALDARGASAAGLLRRVRELRAAGAADDPERLVAAAERTAYTAGPEGWPRRPPLVPDDGIIRASALFREQALAAGPPDAAASAATATGGSGSASGPSGPQWMDLSPWLPPAPARPSAPAAGAPAPSALVPPPLPAIGGRGSGGEPEELDLSPAPPATAAAAPPAAMAAGAPAAAAAGRREAPQPPAPPQAAPRPAQGPPAAPGGSTASAAALITRLTPAQRKQLLARLPPGWRPGLPLPPGTPDLAALIQQLLGGGGGA